jgi:hypothetical protein
MQGDGDEPKDAQVEDIEGQENPWSAVEMLLLEMFCVHLYSMSTSPCREHYVATNIHITLCILNTVS